MQNITSLKKLVIKSKNAEIAASFIEAQKTKDPTERTKKLCVLAGVISYYRHMNNHSTLEETQKLAIDTCESLIKKII